MTVLVCLVEGDGDKAALPVLVRRMCHEAAAPLVEIAVPIRVRRDRFLGSKPEAGAYRAKYLALAKGKAGADGRILILLDSDSDCPARLALEWQAELARLVEPTPLALVFANSEFEAWFIAGADELAKRMGVEAAVPRDPEAVRGAKEWVRSRLFARRRGYSETVDQPRLAASLDWQKARTRAPSLDKLCREIARLLDVPELRG